MLISPTEPARFRELGKVSGVPERYGCDFLITVGKYLTGIQRKKFPSDFLASLADGRLMDQLRSMEKIDRKVLIIEGEGSWTLDGQLVDVRQFTKAQMFGLFYTIAFEFGVEVLRTKDITETIEALVELEHWAGKDKHVSLSRRPGPPTDGWGKRTDEAWSRHLLQGFPGIGPELAQRIIDYFGGVPLRWVVDGPKDLEAIPGIGKGRATKLWEGLHGPRRTDETAEGNPQV